MKMDITWPQKTPTWWLQNRGYKWPDWGQVLQCSGCKQRDRTMFKNCGALTCLDCLMQAHNPFLALWNVVDSQR